MKQKFIILLAFIFTCLNLFQAQTKTLEDPINYTSHIKNSSFESYGLANWTNNGMQSQTNNSPSDQGWQKNGNVYAEKWVSSDNRLTDASVSQIVSGIPNGKYTLKALAHSVNQAGNPAVTKGTFLYAGKEETLVTAGGEYSVETTVTNGKLEIGFKTVNTDANWVAVDYFRLYYHGGDLEGYNRVLGQKIEKALACLSNTNNPGYINREELDNVINAARNAEQTEEAILEAIENLDQAIEEYTSIITLYKALKSKIENVSELLASSDYPDKKDFEETIKNAQLVYDSSEDQRDIIQATIDNLNAKNSILINYNILAKTISNAKKLYESSNYPGKESFGSIINNAQEAYINPKEIDIYKIINQLEEGTFIYLNTRPANWQTIKNGALWKDDRGRGVEAHGAGFLQVGDTWYMIGEDRSGPWNPDVNMYSTKDFINWKFERKIIQNGVTHPDLGNGRFIERPKLMYCKKTGKYVVWCHWEQGNYGASEAAVFYCDSVNGAYTFHWAGRPLGIKSRDCNVFVDNDGTAYFISTTEENQHLGLFKLSDDYLSVVSHTQLFIGQQREAPAVVRIDDTYFMLFSACTGWDPNQTSYSYSKSLTSGWSDRINIGGSIAFDTQAASILTIIGSEGTSYVYVGDRWQDPELSESKTILFPIRFNGNSCVFEYRQQFDLDLSSGTWKESSTENRVPKTDWKVVAYSSQETSSENGAATNAIDGNKNTKWHTRYSGTRAEAPHYIEVDMGNEYEVSGFLCTPRMDSSNNGTIREYLFLVSRDGINWEAVSGGSWLPYCAEVYFQPVKARYFRMVATSGSYACILEMDMLLNTEPYTPQTIIPYNKINARGWANSTEITPKEGDQLTFGPNVNSGKGTWAFFGPRNQMGATREFTIKEITSADAGIYSSLFLNVYNESSKLDYKVLVSDDTSIEEVADSKQEVKRKYYNLQGIEIPYPTSTGIYIIKKMFDDGSSQTDRISFRKLF